MAKVHHSRPDVGSGFVPDSMQVDTGYLAGGRIAGLQADIARRLASRQMDSLPVEPQAEWFVRALSRVGGYVALIAAYGLLIVGFARLL